MKILEIRTRKRLVGNVGEAAAAKLLRKKGYRKITRNYVAAGHEIDLVAENRTERLFVEVKTRTVGHEDGREATPAAAVTPEKQHAMIAAAKKFLSNPRLPEKINRFDVVEVWVSDEEKPKILKIEHLEAAFAQNARNLHHG